MKTIFNPKLYYQVNADPSKYRLITKGDKLNSWEKYDKQTDKSGKTKNWDEFKFDIWLI